MKPFLVLIALLGCFLITGCSHNPHTAGVEPPPGLLPKKNFFPNTGFPAP